MSTTVEEMYAELDSMYGELRGFCLDLEDDPDFTLPLTLADLNARHGRRLGALRRAAEEHPALVEACKRRQK